MDGIVWAGGGTAHKIIGAVITDPVIAVGVRSGGSPSLVLVVI